MSYSMHLPSPDRVACALTILSAYGPAYPELAMRRGLPPTRD